MNGAVGISTEKAEKGLDQGSNPGRGPSSVQEDVDHKPHLEGPGEGQKQDDRPVQAFPPTALAPMIWKLTLVSL